MIVSSRQPQPAGPAWHAGFLAKLPAIQRHARMAFRELKPEARDKAVQEVICNALVAYVGLIHAGKLAVAYPTALAKYAVAQTRDFRKVGGLRVPEEENPLLFDADVMFLDANTWHSAEPAEHGMVLGDSVPWPQ
jgi:hypothetical protein